MDIDIHRALGGIGVRQRFDLIGGRCDGRSDEVDLDPDLSCRRRLLEKRRGGGKGSENGK